MKYRGFIKILEENGFAVARQKGSHRAYKGVVRGVTMLVTVAYTNLGEDVLPKNMASMIRQSGLPKGLFRR